MENLLSFMTQKIGIEPASFEQLMRIAIQKDYKKQEFLIREGQTCRFIAWVLNGVLRSYIIGDTTEHNNDFYFPHSFVSAYTSYLTQTPSNSNIQALTDCTILYFPYHEMQLLLQSHNDFIKLGKYIADEFFIRKCKRETSFLKNTAAERLKMTLESYPDIEQYVSQYHIASYLGIQPESLSRIKAQSRKS